MRTVESVILLVTLVFSTGGGVAEFEVTPVGSGDVNKDWTCTDKSRTKTRVARTRT